MAVRMAYQIWQSIVSQLAVKRLDRGNLKAHPPACIISPSHFDTYCVTIGSQDEQGEIGIQGGESAQLRVTNGT